MNDVKFTRMEKAILSVLYEVHPLGLDVDTIFEIIEERKLLEMSEEEFSEYAHNIILSKQN